MVKKLHWDSAFFGYPVGCIKLTGTISEEMIHLIKGDHNYRLVYVYSDNKLPSAFSKYLVASRVHFEKKLLGKNNQIVVNQFKKNDDSYEELISLAYECGKLSRFRVDSNFINDEYHRLYKRWIDKSLEDSKSRILVTRSGKHITGFITIEFMDDNIGRLGLIAVDNNLQGRGLGSVLVKMVENVSFDAGKYDLRVTTHHENMPAMSILKKNGFEKASYSYVYHLWNI